MADERNEQELQQDSSQQQGQPISGQQSQRNEPGQQAQQSEFSQAGQQSESDRQQADQSFESSDTLTATADQSAGSEESQGDPQGSGFIGSQGMGSDDYLQDDSANPELASEDPLDQQSDGGSGLASGEEEQNF